MSTRPTRRWLQYSLRTLLVGLLVAGLVAVVSLWCYVYPTLRRIILYTFLAVCVCGLLWAILRKFARHRFQFSLRTLLVLVLLVSLLLGWLAPKIRQKKAERRAVEEIERLGGEVLYDYKRQGVDPPGPAWIRKRLGDDVFADMGSVQLIGPEVTDSDMEHLKALGNLQRLSLFAPGITNAGLEHLEALSSLQELVLVKVAITDAGLEHLEALSNLQTLVLYDIPLTNAGLEHLEAFSNLQELVLAKVAITDAGLEHLTSLSSLRFLHLENLGITDAGLEHLKGLASLRELYVTTGTQITEEGIKKLQQALPECNIDHDLPAADPPNPPPPATNSLPQPDPPPPRASPDP